MCEIGRLGVCGWNWMGIRGVCKVCQMRGVVDSEGVELQQVRMTKSLSPFLSPFSLQLPKVIII